MSWLSKIRNALWSRSLDDDLAEELKDHLTRRAEAYREKGLSDREAQAAARIQFGNQTQILESSRQERLWTGIESVKQDIRYGVRWLTKNRNLAITAIASLTLAIGAVAAIYSIIDAAVLRPLPVSNPDRLVRLAEPEVPITPTQSGPEYTLFSYPLYQEFASAAREVGEVAAVHEAMQMDVTLAHAANVQSVTLQWISNNGFSVLEPGPPALGRFFQSADDAHEGGSPFAVISYDFWTGRLARDPHVLGRCISMTVGQMARLGCFQIIGVAPKGFFGTEVGKRVDVWFPFTMYPRTTLVDRSAALATIIARLRPGVTAERLAQALQPAYHANNLEVLKHYSTMPDFVSRYFDKAQLRVHPAAGGVSAFRTRFERPLLIVFAVAASILLIACANVATLLLAQASARSQEIAMRLSLGAGRGRVARQLLTESLLVSLCATALGWWLAKYAAPLLVNLLSTRETQIRLLLHPDLRILLFCTAVCILVTMAFGLLPAAMAVNVDLMQCLRRASGQAGKLRLGHYFVVIQVSFACCLVILGLSFVLTLHNLYSVQRGFEANNLTALTLIDRSADDAKRLRQMNQLSERIRQISGVSDAAIAPWLLFSGIHQAQQVLVPGRAPGVREEAVNPVSQHYFSTMRIPLLAGREFRPEEQSNREPVPTIVNRSFERLYFPAGNAVGSIFRITQGQSSQTKTHRVIGVVADSHYDDLRRSVAPNMYIPLTLRAIFTLYVRSSLPPAVIADTVGRLAKDVEANCYVRDASSIAEIVGDTFVQERLLAGLAATFAGLGLALACIGLFGLLNYSVARRTKEFGIRGALGAQRWQLIASPLRELLSILAKGLIVGLAISFFLLSGFRSLFFGLKLVDPSVVSITILVFLVTAIVAAIIPARRASGVDPMAALREE
jgi:predicted permease